MTEPTKAKKPIELPELNIDVNTMSIRIGRARCLAENARDFAAKIIKLADALEEINK